MRAYALGARRRVDLESWPPRGTERFVASLREGAFVVDPSAPVPALGGRSLLVQMPGSGYVVADQRPLLGRDDVHLA